MGDGSRWEAAREGARRAEIASLVPGATLRLVQRRPSLVVEVGETTLALDEQVAAAIFVRREAS